MRFETEFQVPGTPADVISMFADVPLMAGFLPGASVEEPNPDGSYPGALLVSFGPKRISFKGAIRNQVDAENHTGLVTGQGNADVRGAKLAVTMKYDLSLAEAAGRPVTRVRIVSEAQLSGLLAEFARTGGVALTNAILAEFTRRFSAYVLAEPGQDVSGPVPQQPLSALSLVTQMVTSRFRRGRKSPSTDGGGSK